MFFVAQITANRPLVRKVTQRILILTPVPLKYPNSDYTPTGKMPKVVPEYKEQAKRRIMDAASAEFANKGYRKTTMNDIARRTGVSKAALYQYFETKERLLQAIAEQSLGYFLKSGFSSTKNRNVMDVLEGSFDRGIRRMPVWVPGLICEIQSEALHDNTARRLTKDLNKRFIEVFHEFLEERKNAGEIRSDMDTMAVARALMSLQVGLMAQVATGLSPSHANEAWAEVVRRLASSLGPKK